MGAVQEIEWKKEGRGGEKMHKFGNMHEGGGRGA